MGFWDIAAQMLEARRQAAVQERQPQPATAPVPPPEPTVIAERRDPKTGLIMTETSNIVRNPGEAPYVMVTREPRRPTVTIGTAYGEAAPRPAPGDAIGQAAGFLKKK